MYLINLSISAIIVNICWLYFGSIILNKKVDYKNKKVLFTILLSISMLFIVQITVDSFIKIFINYLIIVFLFKSTFKSDFSDIFVLGFIVLTYYFIAEIAFSIFIALFINFFSILSIEVNNNFMVSPITNSIVSIIAILLSKTKMGKNFEGKMMLLTSKIKSYEIVVLFIIGIALFSSKNIEFLGVNYNFMMNIIMIILFSVIIFILYKEKEKSTALSKKYDQLLNYIEKYELELTNKSMTIHEFKNQIISIKGFISVKNKKANNYIDSIISDIKNLEYSNLSGMENIPPGGLKGLIYFKLGDLKEKGINVITKVQPKMKKNSFCLNNTNLYKDVLKIIGVYLDNAIESVMTSNKKEIIMEMYHEKNKSHFVLINTHNNNVEVDKLDNVGYSTKGNGRGYGLHLVKNIIDNYKNITQSREVTEDYYIIHLTVQNETNKR